MRELAWGQGQTFFRLFIVASKQPSYQLLRSTKGDDNSHKVGYFGAIYAPRLSEVKFELFLLNSIIFLIFSLVWGSVNLSLV